MTKNWEKNKLSYENALKKVLELDKAARSDDPRMSNLVYIQHQDGSSLTYFGAYLVRLSEQWYALITEHHGPRLVCVEDCHHVMEYEQVQWPPDGFKKTMKRLEKIKEDYDKRMKG